MGVDPSILINGYRPTPIEPQSNALARVMELDGMRQRNLLARMQFDDVQAQRQQAMRQAQAQAAARQAIPSPQMLASQQALSGGGGPTQSNAQRMPPVDPRLQAMHPLMQAGLLPVGDYMKAAYPDDEGVVVGGSLVGKRTGNVRFAAPTKPETQKLPQIGELQAYRDSLPQGDPRRGEVDAVIRNQTRAPKYASGGDGAAAQKPPKPLPSGAMKMQQESLDKIGISASINADLGGIVKQIDEGKLSFGPVSNVVNKGLNLAGLSTEQSRNLSTFKSTLERLRNESLRLNSGVQTDGDAQRAWNELFENITDTELVKQRLGEIQKINDRGVELQRQRVNSIRSEYGHDAMDVSGYTKVAPAVGAQPGANGAKPTASAVQTATNPKTGEKLQLVNGQWVPAK